MHIQISRTFVCGADDCTGDAERQIEIHDESTVRELLAVLLALGFLQTSSTNPCLVAKGDRDLALVVPGDNEVIELLPLSSSLLPYLSESKVHFSFDLTREQERLYGEYRRKKLFGSNSRIE